MKRSFLTAMFGLAALSSAAGAATSEELALRGAQVFQNAPTQALGLKAGKPGLPGPAAAAQLGLPCDEVAPDISVGLACEALIKRGVDWRIASGYQVLEALYEEGRAPTRHSLKGWQAGRRFHIGRAKPDAVLMGTLTVEGDGGPLTGPLYKVRQFFGRSPESVDSPKPEDFDMYRNAYEEWNAVSMPEFGAKEASYRSNWDSWDKGGEKGRSYTIRAFGAWTIARYADQERPGGVDRSFYTYFFKTVTPSMARD